MTENKTSANTDQNKEKPECHAVGVETKVRPKLRFIHRGKLIEVPIYSSRKPECPPKGKRIWSINLSQLNG